MLEANIAAQLKTYLDNVKRPIELIASLDDSAKSKEMQELLVEIAGMSSFITLDEAGDDARKLFF
jgi:alkyl hydroperoxide reductase subunit F